MMTPSLTICMIPSAINSVVARAAGCVARASSAHNTVSNAAMVAAHTRSKGTPCAETFGAPQAPVIDSAAKPARTAIRLPTMML